MKKNTVIVALIALSALLFTGCRKEFADLNKSKSAVSTPNVPQLFYESVMKFEPQGYLEWYYNAPMMYTWSQWGVPTGGYTTSFTTTTETGDKGNKLIDVLRYANRIKAYIDGLESEDDKAANMPYYYASKVLAIYLGIFDTDLYGSRAYTQAANYLDGGTLTPEYDTQETLFNTWITELDECIACFTANNAAISSNEDPVFQGDVAKWAKFANSLKLRIAVRLLSQDKAKAQSIASAVVAAPCGYIATTADDVLFNKCTVTSENNDLIYHWNNGFMTGIGANENVVDFMVKNLDPRVRFCYTKNNWSSKIIQAYYDRGKAIPDFIEKDVNFTVSNGKKKFESFKAPGEPWVRYHGLPADFDAGMQNTPNYNEWMFDAAHFQIYKMKDGVESTDGGKSYRCWSYFNLMMVTGRTYQPSNFFATTPDDVHSIASNNRVWYGMYLGAGEINLYLAEFALYNGGSLGGKSAEDYYKAGLTASVEEYDKLNKLNQCMYYGTTYGYDPEDVTIDLKDGEIDTMLAQADYKLTGSNSLKLEKVMLQQLIHFTMFPNESYVTSRRSGFPKFNSTLIPRINFSQVPVTQIPRRFDTGQPVDTDIMYDILMKAYQDQGFTPTSRGENGAILHNERVWYDKGAPEWGAGASL